RQYVSAAGYRFVKLKTRVRDPVVALLRTRHRGRFPSRTRRRFSFPFEATCMATEGVACHECDDQAQAGSSNRARGRDPDRDPGSSLECLLTVGRLAA